MNTLIPVTVTPRRSQFVEQFAETATLREAWWRVQRGGRTAGIDHMTIDAFKVGADARLHQLSQSILDGTYRPSPVRRFLIPKHSGGVRVIAVPTVSDRITQTAAALVLHDRVVGLFSGRSFAYRPFLGPRRAAVFLRSALSTASWVVTADISRFFDNVEHRILADQLRNAGVDEEGIRLITRWLLSPVQDGGRRFQPVKGLPQGSPISPVLANLYLTGFDLMLESEGFTHVRYADDFVVLTNDEAEARRALQYVTTYLRSKLRLDITPAKTQFAQVADGFNFVGFRFTKDAWTIPAESVARFKETLTGTVAAASDRSLAEIAKSHNDLVSGWRNYYYGNSTELDQQLAEMDDWRRTLCAACLEQRGESADAAAVWFVPLVNDQGDGAAPPGAYTHERQHELPLKPPNASKSTRPS